MRGVKAIGKNKKHKLLLQIVTIFLPLFMIMTGAIVYVVYSSTVNGFLEAQNDHIRNMLSEERNYVLFWEVYEDPRIQRWFLEEFKKGDLDYSKEPTLEEDQICNDYEFKENYLDYSWFEEMPEDVRKVYIRRFYYYINDNIMLAIEYYDSAEGLFMMGVGEDHGLVMYDYHKNGKSRNIGEYYDFDIKDHPVLQEMLDTGSADVVFEKTKDFPNSGDYYIGYRPVFIDGEIVAVMGLTYSWDGFKSSLIGTIQKSLIIIIGGMVLILAALLIFLNHRAIKPISKIEKALIEYSADKDTAQIVAKMHKAFVNNEIGYLSDVISDLSLEIDSYTKEVARSEKELYDARIQIMVSQVKPHFMYNTLSSIAMLCEIDPEAAQEMTITFAKYLRENMDSLKQTEPVPFARELEHLKKYLYIEKVRFDERLNIEYDIQSMDFVLPQLSIQPIVENAVKHGVGKKEEGGTVKISTRETSSSYEVIVSDDGVGFDVNAPIEDDGRSHIGMENIKKRLKEMCDADITIESEIGKGTTVTVTIPKKK